MSPRPEKSASNADNKAGMARSPLTNTGEFDYIDWLRSRTPADPRVLIGPGDDTAALRLSPNAQTLVTTDMLLEGSCFLLDEAGPRRVGRKAMAVNLSDIAAMPGRPVAAVVSVGLPRAERRGVSPTWIAQELYAGLREMADAFDTAIVGGDTNSWDGPLAISVTVIGEAIGRGPVRRSGARSGDWLFVTGPLGGSIRGHHLDFMPRVREALQLHAAVELKAMIDISDGLAADLGHVCAESRCGAVLRADAIPIADAARAMADRRSPLEHALGDGEDFELLFAVNPDDGRRLLAQQPVAGMTLVHIGECCPEGMWLETAGRREKLEPRGYVHDFE
jgi:thiamine-monophosphate kinase